MTDWITSDTHFFHKNIIKLQADTRPYADVDEMNEVMIEKWNSRVQPGDTVYHLGDFSFGSKTKTIDLLWRLHGNIRFVYGNHDAVIRNSKTMCSRFEWMKPYHEETIDGTKVCMFHYPIYEWNRSHHGSIHFHGHLHSQREWGRAKDIGCDSNDCEPYNLHELVARMKLNEVKSVYHSPTE